MANRDSRILLPRSMVRPAFALALFGLLAAGLLGVGWRSTSAAGTIPAISVGGEHTCVLTAAGGVQCWGENGDGQLGNGTLTDFTTPIDVAGLTAGVSAIAAGTSHTCALTAFGGVKCWGDNGDGELGNGTTADSSTPVDVTGLTSGVTAIGAGFNRTCAVATGGALKCWGNNDFGELGNGSYVSSSTPVDVSGLGSGMAAVSPGWRHTCALTTGGGVKCWGSNDEGQLGSGNFLNTNTPVDVVGLGSDVASVSAGGGPTCAVTTAGGVKCWGLTKLGFGSYTDNNTPYDVTGLTSGMAGVSSGKGASCAVSTAGAIKCWGDNSYGQVGNGTSTSSPPPANVSGLTSGAASISAHSLILGSHVCAVTTAGAVKCWGSNSSGQLGNGNNTGPQQCPLGFGTFPCSTTPVDVSGLGPKPTPTPTPNPVGGVARLDPLAAAQLQSKRTGDGDWATYAVAGAAALAAAAGATALALRRRADR